METFFKILEVVMVGFFLFVAYKALKQRGGDR